MTTSAMKTELLHHLNRLPVAMQCQVLQFARSLEMIAHSGVSGATLVSFAGSIPVEDLNDMAQAIEDDCERIDSNEW